MTACLVTGCGRAVLCRGVCKRHYEKLRRFGDPNAGETRQQPYRSPGTGTVSPTGHIFVQQGAAKKGVHVMLAERALGRPLPPGAEVHHLNDDPGDNRPENLVICPSTAYHQLIHMRARALAACGNANWRRCYICKQHDAPERLLIAVGRTETRHRACATAKSRKYRAAQRERMAPA